MQSEYSSYNSYNIKHSQWIARAFLEGRGSKIEKMPDVSRTFLISTEFILRALLKYYQAPVLDISFDYKIMFFRLGLFPLKLVYIDVQDSLSKTLGLVGEK